VDAVVLLNGQQVAAYVIFDAVVETEFRPALQTAPFTASGDTLQINVEFQIFDSTPSNQAAYREIAIDEITLVSV
jgi:hypothetical protein